jgi:hypothetical protein
MITFDKLSLDDLVEVYVNSYSIIDHHKKDYSKYKTSQAKVIGLNSSLDHEVGCSIMVEVLDPELDYWLLPLDHKHTYESQGFVFSKNLANNTRCWQIPYTSIKSISSNKTTHNDGCFCLECKEFYPYAVPNMDKGLLCYSCRSTNLWKYK